MRLLPGAVAVLIGAASLYSAAADEDPSPIRVNQIGYLTYASKKGVIVDSNTSPLTFQVKDALTDEVMMTGTTTVYGDDSMSGDHVHHADFSSMLTLGSYKLVVGNQESVPFDIAPSLYPNLPHEAMNYFYFHRMGVDGVLGQHLDDARFARAAIHPGDNSIPPYEGWCSGCSNFDLLGSWADAGDFGLYSVNHAISAWSLLNLLEAFPEAFGDGSLNIPESSNGVPDILDEADYGSQFMKGMLPSDGGLASHKAHNHAWSDFVITIGGENSLPRSAMGPSTPATYAVARVCAHLARMWQVHGGEGSTAHINDLWEAAKDAWSRAESSPSTPYSGPSPGPAIGGGDYPDSGPFDDEQFSAAVEMYLTAYALGSADVTSYKSTMVGSTHFESMSQFDWGSVAGAGTLSLMASTMAGTNDLATEDVAAIKNSIVNFADSVIDTLRGEGYPANINSNPINGQPVYPWGSNSFIVNRAIALAYAYEITSDTTYHDYILQTMDYLMGVNAMRISYITGYGEYTETDTHDRWAWTIGSGSFWPKGWLSGGPNNELINDWETPNVEPAKSYAAKGTAPHAWGSKENTVNWNAPFAWLAWYVENKVSPTLGGCTGNCVPQAYGQTMVIEKNAEASIELGATDLDGSIVDWTIHQSPTKGTLSGTMPNLIYTPSLNELGDDFFTFSVTDDTGATSNQATVAIQIRQCNYFDKFGVPPSESYPSGSTTYFYAHVSEGGPTLSGFQDHVVNLGESGQMYEFAFHLATSPYYLQLNSCMSQQSVSKEISISDCGFPGLAGDYWIKKVGSDTVWVEKNGDWAIMFSNDPTPPEFCLTGGGPTTPSPVSPTGSPIPPTDSPVHSPTDSPIENPTLTPSNVPTKAPSIPEGCFSNNYKDCVHPNWPEDNWCDKIWLPTGAQSNCIGLWGDCTGQESSCCGPARCHGDGSVGTCVPDPDEPVTSPPSPAPTNACLPCTDIETSWMANNGKDCTTSNLIYSKCNMDPTWAANKFCQKSCYDAGNGYDGDICCSSSTSSRRLRGNVE